MLADGEPNPIDVVRASAIPTISTSLMAMASSSTSSRRRLMRSCARSGAIAAYGNACRISPNTRWNSATLRVTSLIAPE